VDTRALPAVPYRARLEQRRPAGWLTDRTRHELTPVEMLALLEQVARTNRLFYLHPSFGRFFEGFYLEPAGMIYEMKPRGKDPLDLPPMNAASREANEQFWTRWWELELAELVSPPTRPAWWERAGARLGLSPAPRDQDRLLRDWYSIPLGTWGVALQRQGRLREAQTRLEQALLLNPNNLPAWFSLAWNKNAQAGNHTGLSDFRRLASQPGNPNLMPGVLNSSGPFDEPTVGYFIGSVYYDHGMLVQAAEAMERVRAQVPGAPAPEMKLVAIYNLLRMPERSRPLVNHLRETFRNAPANSLLDTELAMQESYSWVLQTNLANASETLQALVRQYPDDPHIASRVVGALLAFRDVTNAWQLAEERLAKSPDDVAALNDEAMVLLQSGQAAAALPLLNHILTLTNMPAAHRNRAFARIATRDFAQGKTELIELENTGAADGLVDYGLALVAWHGHETNSARHYLQLSLSNSPAGGPLWQQAKTGLRMLELAK
jgi:tetratricopeptide (TPR) repeat protein